MAWPRLRITWRAQASGCLSLGGCTLYPARRKDGYAPYMLGIGAREGVAIPFTQTLTVTARVEIAC